MTSLFLGNNAVSSYYLNNKYTENGLTYLFKKTTDKGVMFDPSRVGTLYQTTAMQIPARVGDPVGMMLDQSQWGDTALGDVYGPELGVVSFLGNGWTDNGDGTYTTDGSDTTGTGRLQLTGSLDIGRYYLVSVQSTMPTTLRTGGTTIGATPNGASIHLATSSNFNITTGTAGTVTGFSIREVTVASALEPIMGPELVTNGDFSAGIAGWESRNSAILSAVSGKLRVAGNGAATYPFAVLGIQTVIGKTYRWSALISRVSGATNSGYLEKSDSNATFSSNNVDSPPISEGPASVTFTATATTSYLRLLGTGANDVYDFDDVSVREIPGHHATQATAAKRPTYGIHPITRYGPELVSNGGFNSDLAGWVNGSTGTGSAAHSSGSAAVSGADSSNRGILSQGFSTVVGKTYQVQFDVVETVAGNSYPRVGVSENSESIYTFPNQETGVYSKVITATASTTFLTFNVTNGTFNFDNVSVREVIAGQRNLLTYTEDFSNAVWTKQNLTVAGKTLTPTATNTSHNLIYSASGLDGSGVYTASGRASAAGYDFLLIRIDNGAGDGVKVSFNIATGAVSNAAAPAGTGWTMLGAGITPSPDGGFDFYISFTLSASATGIRLIPYVSNVAADAFAAPAFLGDGASGIILHETQLEAGATATDYQKVVSKYEVTEAGVPSVHYLSFDGVDDAMVTPSIDFTATDEMSIFAGVRKLSDTAALVTELGPNVGGGKFYLVAGEDSGARYSTFSTGTAAAKTTQVGKIITEGYAPDTAILSAANSISADLSSIRRNGKQGTNGTVDKGEGNFGNHPLNIGSRDGTSLFFKGNLYTLTVRGAATSDGGVSRAEKLIAAKTGIEI